MKARQLVLLLLCIASTSVLFACAPATKTPPQHAVTKIAPPAPKPPIDPREATAYVEAQLTDVIIKQFETIIASPQCPDGFRKILQDNIEARFFGSGFVLDKSPPGVSWIVTNNHVVMDKMNVVVSFDGGKTKLPVKIILADLESDLAILELPGTRRGFELGPTVKEEQPVTAVGYPGVNGKPEPGSYQITSGTVSNACFGSEDGAKGMSCFIQHTASIDEGSSGGPLLDAQRRVVGVNTALIPHSSGKVPIATSAMAVQKVLNEAHENLEHAQDKAWMTSALQKSCQDVLAKVVDQDPSPLELTPLMSTTLVESDGMQAVRHVQERQVYAAFKTVPVMAMQVSLAFYVKRNLNALGGPKDGETCSSIDPKDDVTSGKPVHIQLALKGGPETLVFIRDRGAWRVADF